MRVKTLFLYNIILTTLLALLLATLGISKTYAIDYPNENDIINTHSNQFTSSITSDYFTKRLNSDTYLNMDTSIYYKFKFWNGGARTTDSSTIDYINVGSYNAYVYYYTSSFVYLGSQIFTDNFNINDIDNTYISNNNIILVIFKDDKSFTINYNNSYTFDYTPNEYIATPSKQGHLFKGWIVETDNPNIDTLFLHDEQSLNTELYGAYNDNVYTDRPIVNIYEQWLKVTVEQQQYISFDLNGGIGSYPDYYYFIPNVQTPNYILNYKPTRDGHFFGGWQYITRDNALNGSINPRELSSEDDGTFRAIWIAGSYESGYDDGFINGQDNGFINGRNQYGIFYNNKWYTASEYGQIMYYNGLNETDSFGFVGLLGSIFGGLGTFLAIELLPNISIGAIILIPIVFGLLAFILGRKK